MIPKYDLFEAVFQGPADGNPFLDVDLTAVFQSGACRKQVSGFYDGEGKYVIRYMPELEGTWEFQTSCNVPSLDGLTGSFVCGSAREGSHGPVRVSKRFHFAYADGTPFYPFGTTAYNWVNQPQDTILETLKTLSENSFNKIRMGTFPKYYLYNLDDPADYPFPGGLIPGRKVPDTFAFFGNQAENYDFDYNSFNPVWWRKLEWCIQQLRELGIQADLIVFHPYDRWGFSEMPKDVNLRYLRYLAARLSAYSNVWWSMANEWDLFMKRTPEEWELYAEELLRWDPSDHLCGIHNCTKMFDQSKKWITHVSWQRIDYYSHVELVAKMREEWQKPIVVDEICYEGNIDAGWGNITGEELTRRFWEVVVRGGYCTHGETYLRDDQKLWWAKGGTLSGSSPARIAFCRSIVEDMGDIDPEPTHTEWDLVWGHAGTPVSTTVNTPFGMQTVIYSTDMICYFGFARPCFRDFILPEQLQYSVEIIDTWNMHITKLPETVSGKCRVDLPGIPGIAVRFRAI